MREAIQYIERCTGADHNGPAWIARVRFSKSGRTAYFNGHALQRSNGAVGNHVDQATGDAWWITGVKKSGTNRHAWGSGPIYIERSLEDWYREHTAGRKLTALVVIDDLPKPDIAKFPAHENAPH